MKYNISVDGNSPVINGIFFPSVLEMRAFITSTLKDRRFKIYEATMIAEPVEDTGYTYHFEAYTTGERGGMTVNFKKVKNG